MSKFLTTLAVTGVVFIAGCNKEGDWNHPSGSVNSNQKAHAIQVNGPAPLVIGSVPLGVAGNFVILSKAGITDVPPSVITGDIGTSPISGTAIGVTCAEMLSGTIYTVSAAGPMPCRVINPGMLTVAVLNMQTAYTDAAGRTATSAATTNVGGGTLTGLTLAAGVYEWGSTVNVTIPTDLTLNGSATDVWIFNINGTLDMASGGKTTGKSVILTGGALPQNIFWRVSGAVTLGTYSHFEGTILAMTNIVMQTGASINGRLLAQTAVTLDQNTVTFSGTSGGGTNPPVYCRDFVTGGGWINGNSNNSGHKNDKSTFGVSGGIKNGEFWGQLSFNDHNGKSVKSTSVTDYIVIDAVTRRIDGLAKVNGHGSYAYSVVVTDNGEPGRDDHFILNVNIDGVRYHAEGDLIGGNIQLHMACGDSNDNHDKGDKNDHFKKDQKDDHNNGDKEDYSDKDENDGHHNCENHE